MIKYEKQAALFCDISKRALTPFTNMFDDELAVADNKIAIALNLAVLKIKHGKEEKVMSGLSIRSAKQGLSPMVRGSKGKGK